MDIISANYIRENYLNVQGIRDLSNVENISLLHRYIKLNEEVGELAAAILNHIDSPNKSASSRDNILEEGTDILLCLLDTLFSLGYKNEDIQRMINVKNIKWENKINKLK